MGSNPDTDHLASFTKIVLVCRSKSGFEIIVPEPTRSGLKICSLLRIYTVYSYICEHPWNNCTSKDGNSSAPPPFPRVT